eukprot:3204510-Rhodomonas_salina.2
MVLPGTTLVATPAEQPGQLHPEIKYKKPHFHTLSAYAPAMQCPVLRFRMEFAAYGMCGADIVYCTRCAVLTWRVVLCDAQH